MSSSFRWILVKTEADAEDIPEGLREVRLHSFGTFDGWFVADLSKPRGSSSGGSRTSRGPRALKWSFPAFEEVVTTASDGRPCLGITCVTSDFLWLIAVSPDLPPVTAVTNPQLARDYADGAQAVDRCLAEYGEDRWQQTAAGRLSDWSRHARRVGSAAEIESILVGEYVFAEEAAGGLLSAFGLPAPPEAHPRFKEAIYVRDHGSESGPWGVTKNSILPFVTGHGIDFHGVWSSSGSEPIARFPRTPDGEQDAMFARLAMLLPPDERYQGAIVVFDRRLDRAGVIKPYPYAFRYVVGVVADSYGVWRRRRAGRPIATFPRTWAGLSEAQRWAIERSLPFIRLAPSWRRRRRATE